MAKRKSSRRRWTLAPRVIDFETVDLELTMEDIMTELETGWASPRRPGTAVPRPSEARPSERGIVGAKVPTARLVG